MLAQEEARLLDHSFIGTEHILLGLIAEGEGVAARTLEQLDVDLDEVRRRVQATIGLTGKAPTGSPPFTPRAKKVLELALREALQLGHNYIGTEHMLLGLVREGEGVASQVLVSLGIDLAKVRQKVIQLVAAEPDPETDVASISEPSGQDPSHLAACSFCGREPPESGRLVAGAGAFICEHCLRRWHQVIERPPATSGFYPEDAGAATRRTATPGTFRGGRPPRVRRAVPMYDDEAARRQIEKAFAEHATTSEDGRDLLMVEDGKDLGPTLRAAVEKRRDVVPEGAEVATIVEHIRFYGTADRSTTSGMIVEHATVTFSLVYDDRTLLGGRRGEAVLVGGTWKMSRRTFCELMSLAGVECPPPADRAE